MLQRGRKTSFLLLPALITPALIFAFTLGRYYGFYYDNHYFNLLALDLMGGLRPWFYLGSHYSIHSSLYSWVVLPLFYVFGPTDFSMELLAAIFHLGTVFLCFKFGERFFSRSIGLILAFLTSIAPAYFINIYTWPECSLVALLNLAGIYYFLAGFCEQSKKKIILSAILFSLSCLQAIYSLLLLPVYLIYALLRFRNTTLAHSGAAEMPAGRRPSVPALALRSIFYFFLITAGAYLAAIIEAMYVGGRHRILYYAVLLLGVFSAVVIFRRLPVNIRRALSFTCLFFVITGTVLVLSDLFVQLDMNFFSQRFGYYRDTVFAGGFGVRRPLFIFRDAPLAILGRPLYLSVLSSVFAFSSLYSRVSFSFVLLYKTMLDYYKSCFPPAVNVFIVMGMICMLADILRQKIKKYALSAGLIFALAWLLGITLAFLNSYSEQMLRTYILPMPYLFAALGVYYPALAAQYIFRRRGIFILTSSILLLLISVRQLLFLKDNIYDKYKYDKARCNYFKLFNGWPYGREYKEVGDFLLKDAPLKERGEFRSIFIYTIAGDTAQGICSLFYNNIDWYTQNQIKIVYDSKPVSRLKYGSQPALKEYLARLFADNPGVKAVYFADFYDNKDNFSFFSKVHPEIRPYVIINDDDNPDYDCVLYKFYRNNLPTPY